MKTREVNLVSETEYLTMGLPTLNAFSWTSLITPKASVTLFTVSRLANISRNFR